MGDAGMDEAGSFDHDPEVRKPDFVSDDVWKVVELAASQNSVSVLEYIEKALLDEALILEQRRFGRTWLVKDRYGRLGEVDFE